MIITKKALPRRTFLRGVGATIAIPFLDAMIPSLSAQSNAIAAPIKRLGFFYIPMGSNPVEWMPQQTGRLSELSSSLSPLSPFMDHLTVLSNMEIPSPPAIMPPPIVLFSVASAPSAPKAVTTSWAQPSIR